MKSWIIAIQACVIALLLGIAIAGSTDDRPVQEPTVRDHNVGWVERSAYDRSYRDKLHLGNLADCLRDLDNAIDDLENGWWVSWRSSCDNVVRSY